MLSISPSTWAIMKETPIQLQSARRYMTEFAGAILLYTATLLPAVWWIRENPDSGARWLVGLIPLFPTLLAAWAMVRFFNRMDELARRKLTETLAFAFAGSALLVLTLGFLQVAGLPLLSMWWVWIGMGAMWILGSMMTGLRYR